MKKIISLLLLAVSLSTFAEVYPTKFLGIPIDGTKEEMTKKLQQKGFRYDGETDALRGEFNGEEVLIRFVTNNNKVWRVFVNYATPRDGYQIRLAYNKLFNQFSNNKNYISADLQQEEISAKEDIAHEMLINDKTYEASFLQKTHELDTTAIKQYTLDCVESVKTYSALEGKVYTDEESAAAAMLCMFLGVKSEYLNNSVWFRITKIRGEYYISLYYDNLNNQANGEDL